MHWIFLLSLCSAALAQFGHSHNSEEFTALSVNENHFGENEQFLNTQEIDENNHDDDELDEPEHSTMPVSNEVNQPDVIQRTKKETSYFNAMKKYVENKELYAFIQGKKVKAAAYEVRKQFIICNTIVKEAKNIRGWSMKVQKESPNYEQAISEWTSSVREIVELCFEWTETNDNYDTFFRDTMYQELGEAKYMDNLVKHTDNFIKKKKKLNEIFMKFKKEVEEYRKLENSYQMAKQGVFEDCLITQVSPELRRTREILCIAKSLGLFLKSTKFAKFFQFKVNLKGIPQGLSFGRALFGLSELSFDNGFFCFFGLDKFRSIERRILELKANPRVEKFFGDYLIVEYLYNIDAAELSHFVVGNCQRYQ